MNLAETARAISAEIRSRLSRPNLATHMNEEDHTYRMDAYPDLRFVSVTTALNAVHKPFDKEYYARKKAKELFTTPKAVLNMWQRANDFACNKGTLVHAFLEDSLNSFPERVDESKYLCDDEKLNRAYLFSVAHAKAFLDDYVYAGHLYPVASELVLGVAEWGIAGTIDQLFMDTDGNLLIYDWKTNKNFVSSYKTKTSLLPPFDGYPDEKLTTYSIQLRTYKRMFEYLTGLHVSDCRLVWFSEEERRHYEVYETLDNLPIDSFLKEIVNDRKKYPRR